MRRTILTALITLTALGGVAAADHHRGGGIDLRDHRGGVAVTPSRGRYVAPRQSYSYGRHYEQPRYRYSRAAYVRRPIYVARPHIAVRYYNYYQPPTVLAESYPAMPGYYWVAGHWDWNGYEWLWNPGHYEPDPSYVDPAYTDGYYDNNGY